MLVGGLGSEIIYIYRCRWDGINGVNGIAIIANESTK
jgi:hypothetical protein